MNLKKIKIIGTIVIFIFTVIFHFTYDLLPNALFSVLFPVNESIWEHMKLLYSGILTWGLIEYFILKKRNISTNNYWYQLFLTSFTSIPLFLIIYLPLYELFGENLILNIILLIIVIAITQLFSYILLKNSEEKTILNKISIILIILGYIVFAILTYNPPKNYIFYDTQKNYYGIIEGD